MTRVWKWIAAAPLWQIVFGVVIGLAVLQLLTATAADKGYRDMTHCLDDRVLRGFDLMKSSHYCQAYQRQHGFKGAG